MEIEKEEVCYKRRERERERKEWVGDKREEGEIREERRNNTEVEERLLPGAGADVWCR